MLIAKLQNLNNLEEKQDITLKKFEVPEFLIQLQGVSKKVRGELIFAVFLEIIQAVVLLFLKDSGLQKIIDECFFVGETKIKLLHGLLAYIAVNAIWSFAMDIRRNWGLVQGNLNTLKVLCKDKIHRLDDIMREYNKKEEKMFYVEELVKFKKEYRIFYAEELVKVKAEIVRGIKEAAAESDKKAQKDRDLLWEMIDKKLSDKYKTSPNQSVSDNERPSNSGFIPEERVTTVNAQSK